MGGGGSLGRSPSDSSMALEEGWSGLQRSCSALQPLVRVKRVRAGGVGILHHLKSGLAFMKASLYCAGQNRTQDSLTRDEKHPSPTFTNAKKGRLVEKKYVYHAAKDRYILIPISRRRRRQHREHCQMSLGSYNFCCFLYFPQFL